VPISLASCSVFPNFESNTIRTRFIIVTTQVDGDQLPESVLKFGT
jgi:hypothetical protein